MNDNETKYKFELSEVGVGVDADRGRGGAQVYSLIVFSHGVYFDYFVTPIQRPGAIKDDNQSTESAKGGGCLKFYWFLVF